MSVGKPGYSSVDMSIGVEAAAGVDADVVFADFELDAALLKLCDDGAEVRGVAAVDVEVAAGDGGGDEEGAGLDAVRIDAVLGAVELCDAFDLDGAGAGAFDLGAHGVEQGGEVGDLGFAGAVFEEGFAVGEGGGHEEVFGAGDGDLVEDDVRAFEAVGAGFEIAVLLGDGGAHGLEALDVEVDGAAADGAAAGHGDTGHAGAGDQPITAPLFSKTWTQRYRCPSAAVSTAQVSTTSTSPEIGISARVKSWRGLNRSRGRFPNSGFRAQQRIGIAGRNRGRDSG